MKASELRLGNWVQIDGKTYQVDAVIKTNTSAGFELYVKDIDYDYAIHANPIPLTDEWLLKFGFEKESDGDYRKGETRIKEIYPSNLIGISYSFFTNDIDIGCENEKETWSENIGPELKFVHSLQNLYFALTGEELTIKEPVIF